MTFVEQNLWCDVLRSTANGVCTLGDDLRKTVVNQFEVAIGADHDVLGLQVTVHYVLTVQVLENGSDLRAIKPKAVRLS